MSIDNKNISAWLSSGKQLGVRGKVTESNETIWLSMGIQKHGAVYKTYISEIFDSKINIEEYLREEIKEFSTLEAALKYLDRESRLSILDLSPCKGQKIFNPNFST